MNFLEKIEVILKDKNALLDCAEICANAHNKSIFEHTEVHFDEHTDSQIIGQNLAGLQALISGLCHIQNCLYENVPTIIHKDEIGMGILHRLNDEAINKFSQEAEILKRFANATWGAQQSMRLDGDRLLRMNIYDLLSKEEQDKDWLQIITSAKWLYQEIKFRDKLLK